MEHETPLVPAVGDVALGGLAVVAMVAREAADVVARVVGSAAPAARSRLVRLVLRPPGVPRRLSPASLAAALADRGRETRERVLDAGVNVGREGVPALIGAVLDQLDMTAIVHDRVDLDALAAGLDIDAIAGRLDVQAVVNRVDLDAVVRRVDLDAVVRRVDLDAVADRVDVNQVAERVDLDAIIDRLDLVGLAEYIVDQIDLPGIIRESSSSMASEAVRGVRMQGLEADQAVSRAVDRLLRRRERSTSTP